MKICINGHGNNTETPNPADSLLANSATAAGITATHPINIHKPPKDLFSKYCLGFAQKLM
jgi:hypothetical protein